MSADHRSRNPGALRAGKSILPHWQDVKAGQLNARAQITACYRTSPSAVRPPSRHSSSHIGTTSPPFSRDYKPVRCDVHNILRDCRFFSFLDPGPGLRTRRDQFARHPRSRRPSGTPRLRRRAPLRCTPTYHRAATSICSPCPGSVCGKSKRKCVPRLSLRARAAAIISRATSSMFCNSHPDGSANSLVAT